MTAQRDWFAHGNHGNHGDPTGLLSGCCDLTTAGPEREPESYRSIARTLARPPGQILFLSDVRGEPDAAAASGRQTLGVRRPGDPQGPVIGGHRRRPDWSRQVNPWSPLALAHPTDLRTRPAAPTG
ncbi:HAD family hydrolase [Streptomyces celluloflavus]|uniref:hypothetical protein n=1 Tax=Streptomyces celluloflavus TaxID=58344 RepID=UPI0036C7E744